VVQRENESQGVPAGNLNQVVQSTVDALAGSRAQAEALIRQGMSRYRAGDLAGAVADYTAALALVPQFVEALNNRGVARHARGEYADALADYDAALRLKPTYAEAYCNRGVTRQAQGDLAGALADYDQAVHLHPGYAEAYNNRGALRMAQRELNGALTDFNEALRLNPNYVEAYDNRAGAHYLRWEHAAAVADFGRALALYEEASAPRTVFCRLHLHRGDARYHAGDSDGLLDDYRRAFELDPRLAARLFVERLAADIRANLQLVLANCDKHLMMNPADHIVHARRGLVYLLMGQDADAERDFEQFHRKRTRKLGLLEIMIPEARKYRDEHGPVQPGEGQAPGSAPPGR
jgi:Tfp pilus assembly protein PilF